MAGVGNNLYPPIVDSYAPAFIYTDACKIYFDISEYNELSDFHRSGNTIDLVQIIVQDQKSNKIMLDENLYPSGIKLTTVEYQTGKGYYVTILPSDMRDGGFGFNQYYKIQIRFTSKDAADISISQKKINNWLSENLQYFSQWSSVVLIKGISQPSLYIRDMAVENIYHTHILVQGQVTFLTPSGYTETEYLKYYTVKLYDNKNTLLEDSDLILSQDNKIVYTIKYNLLQGESYKIQIQIVTSSYYSFPTPQSYSFTISNNIKPFNGIQIQAIENNNIGCIQFTIINNLFQGEESPDQKINTFDFQYIDNETMPATLVGSTLYFNYVHPKILNTQETIIGGFDSSKENLRLEKNYLPFKQGMKILVRRTSNRTNFTKWDDLIYIPADSNNIKTVKWKDFTVEPGVFYQYAFIQCNQNNDLLKTYQIDKKLMIESWDIFLSSGSKQLKLIYDPQIGNLSTKINETMIETLGSQYPFIRRNGAIKYKTFSLSGTICSYIDLQNLETFKATKEEVFLKAYDSYTNYYEKNNIKDWNDILYEKYFREKVVQFLQQGTIKLFRSLTQGNMLVKLSDISLTPNISLGRKIYSFSCTVYEIADSNDMNKVNKFSGMNNNIQETLEGG